jgi:hypothetical protein
MRPSLPCLTSALVDFGRQQSREPLATAVTLLFRQPQVWPARQSVPVVRNWSKA